jgi:hypothetical protein
MSSLLPTTTDPESLPLWFDVPGQFTEIDLAAEPEQRATSLAAQLARALPGTTPEQRLHVALAQEAMIAQLLDAGAVYAATMLAQNEDDGPPRMITAQFTVLVQDVDGAETPMLEASAERLQGEETPRDVGMVTLPAGKALGVIEDDEVSLPSSVFGKPEETTYYTRQAQLTLPFPDEKHLVTFCISTECLGDWTDLLEIFAGVARSVSFSPHGGSAITRALNPGGPFQSKPDEPGTPRRSISDALSGNTD